MKRKLMNPNIEATGEKIEIFERIEPERKTIKELFGEYQGDYQLSEIDWGDPVGEEIW